MEEQTKTPDGSSSGSFGNIDRMVIGEEIKNAREKAGLTREKTRKLLGHFDKNLIYRWQVGRRKPSFETAIQLCNIFGCSINQLCPSLWKQFSIQIEARRASLVNDEKRLSFRREPAYRKRKWETESMNRN
jgi:DNA-binding XRE family transcriptional regulator